MNIFFIPVNVKQWNIFDNVKNIGHTETFLATKSMEIGDLILLHVGQQDRNYESGIYALAEIIKSPYILENHPDDYCNNKNTVDAKIVKMKYSNPYIAHKECKKFINQFRSVHKIKDVHYDEILNSID